MNPMIGQNPRHREADRENGRLCVFSEAEIFFRTFKDQFRQREAKRFISFGKCIRGYRKGFSQGAAHADRLRPLAGKEECDSSGHFSEDSILSILLRSFRVMLLQLTPHGRWRETRQAASLVRFQDFA